MIHYADGTFQAANGTVATLAGADLTMTLGSGKYIDYIELLDVASGGGGKFQLVDVSTVTNTGTLNLNFNVNVTDADGDVSTGTLAVTVDGSNPIDGSAGNDALAGDSNANTINGLAGNDILVGGLGNDTLNGGSGSDTFKWGAADSGGSDTITGGFVKGPGGDVLDVSQLLVGDTTGTLVTGGFLHFTYAGGNTTITVNSNGNTAGGTTQSIVLQGVDLLGGGTEAALLTQLLNDGNLKT